MRTSGANQHAKKWARWSRGTHLHPSGLISPPNLPAAIPNHKQICLPQPHRFDNSAANKLLGQNHSTGAKRNMINAITKVCTHKIHSKMYPNLFLSGALHTYAYMHEVLDLYYQHEVLLTYMHISIYFACFVYVICLKSARTLLSTPSPSSYAARDLQNNALLENL